MVQRYQLEVQIQYYELVRKRLKEKDFGDVIEDMGVNEALINFTYVIREIIEAKKRKTEQINRSLGLHERLKNVRENKQSIQNVKSLKKEKS